MMARAGGNRYRHDRNIVLRVAVSPLEAHRAVSCSQPVRRFNQMVSSCRWALWLPVAAVLQSRRGTQARIRVLEAVALWLQVR